MANQQISQPQTVADIAPHMSYLTALASIKLLRETGVLDMTEDDYAFFTADRLWLPVDRSRARRCVEAAVYGALDYIGYPRFPAPAEWIAAAIAVYVHPLNLQTACLIMDGAEFSENIINGVERAVSGQELFAHVLRVLAGIPAHVNAADNAARQTLKNIGA
ncbi:hypothetical protein [Pectobacterium phage Mimer]|nr:external scaffolding protein [Pectobacterium phage Mimer]